MRNPTRPVKVGSVTIGGGHPIVVQSMCATKTADVEATVAQVDQLARAGAGVVRIAVDTPHDAKPWPKSAAARPANLSVDLQENYRLAAEVAPLVDKIRYNPGHLYHHERGRPWQDKVRFLVDVAGEHDCALRVGVNCGSVDPAKQSARRFGRTMPRVRAAGCRSTRPDARKRLGTLRIARPARVHAVLRVAEGLRSGQGGGGEPAVCRPAARRAAAPGRDRGRHAARGNAQDPAAFEQLLSQGIGDTIRVSLTVPAARKHEEIEAGRQILADVAAGRLLAAGHWPRAD